MLVSGRVNILGSMVGKCWQYIYIYTHFSLKLDAFGRQTFGSNSHDWLFYI